jgi:hypothetical protein
MLVYLIRVGEYSDEYSHSMHYSLDRAKREAENVLEWTQNKGHTHAFKPDTSPPQRDHIRTLYCENRIRSKPPATFSTHCSVRIEEWEVRV